MLVKRLTTAFMMYIRLGHGDEELRAVPVKIAAAAFHRFCPLCKETCYCM
jgi:hypothetical protein